MYSTVHQEMTDRLAREQAVRPDRRAGHTAAIHYGHRLNELRAGKDEYLTALARRLLARERIHAVHG